MREAEVEIIELGTSGFFARTKEGARKVLGNIVGALRERKEAGRFPVVFNLRLSLDMFHQERIPLKTIRNLIEVMGEESFSKFGIYFRSIDISGDTTTQELATLLSAKLTPVEDYVCVMILPDGRRIPILYKNLAFDGRFAGRQDEFLRTGYGFTSIREFLQRSGMKNPEGNIVHAFADANIEARQLDGLNGTISFDGRIYILEGLAPDNSLSIYRDSFADFQKKAFRDIITRALLSCGVNFVLNIVAEVEPSVVSLTDKMNHWDGVVEEILGDPHIRLYVTIRLIQIYRSEEKLREDELGLLAKKMSDVPREELVRIYHQQKPGEQRLSSSPVENPSISVERYYELRGPVSSPATLPVPFFDSRESGFSGLPLWTGGLVRSGALPAGLPLVHFDKNREEGFYSWISPVTGESGSARKSGLPRRTTRPGNSRPARSFAGAPCFISTSPFYGKQACLQTRDSAQGP